MTSKTGHFELSIIDAKIIANILENFGTPEQQPFVAVLRQKLDSAAGSGAATIAIAETETSNMETLRDSVLTAALGQAEISLGDVLLKLEEIRLKLGKIKTSEPAHRSGQDRLSPPPGYKLH